MNAIGFASMLGVCDTGFDEIVERAGELGLTSLEVNVGPLFPAIGTATYGGHLDVVQVLERGPKPVLELCDRFGVTISALAPMLNVLTPDKSRREDRIAYVRDCIRACRALGVSLLVTFAGSPRGMYFWGPPGAGPRAPSSELDECLRVFRDVYSELAAFASDHGVRIAFETAGRGAGEGNLAHSPAVWSRMFDAVDSPALGLSFDPSHLVWLGIPNVGGLVREFSDRIFHAEAKDTEMFPEVLARQGIWGNGWWRYRLPGKGQVDWNAYLSALADIGYSGPLTIENEDPLSPGLDAIAEAAAFLRDLVEPLAVTERRER